MNKIAWWICGIAVFILLLATFSGEPNKPKEHKIECVCKQVEE